jgi:hypothetical protein
MTISLVYTVCTQCIFPEDKDKYFQKIINGVTLTLMAIYTVIQLSITIYTEEPIYIYTDSLNSLYLINTQLRHPSMHNNHPDRTILTQIVAMLQS